MDFGRYLKQLMAQKDLGVNELANLSGISGAHISRIISGKRSVPSPKTIKKLSIALGVDYSLMMEAAGHVESRNHPTAPPLPPDLIPATRTVPILGSIPCGIPAAEYEDRLGEEFLPPDLPPGEYYYLYARGDSMEPTISDGEKVLIQVTTDVFNGRIYAVLIDHESTLKRVYRYDGRIELVPDNPKYPRQVYSSTNIYIHGLVIRATRDIK